MANHGKIEATDRPLTREERRAVGRAHFDTGATRITNPLQRENFAAAFAEITRPFGSR